jgi:hypothetical protein
MVRIDMASELFLHGINIDRGRKGHIERIYLLLFTPGGQAREVDMNVSDLAKLAEQATSALVQAVKQGYGLDA